MENKNVLLLNSISLEIWGDEKWYQRLRFFNTLIDCGLRAFDNNSLKHYVSKGYLHGIWDELMEHFVIEEIVSEGIYISEKMESGKLRRVLLFKWFEK